MSGRQTWLCTRQQDPEDTEPPVQACVRVGPEVCSPAGRTQCTARTGCKDNIAQVGCTSLRTHQAQTR